MRRTLFAAALTVVFVFAASAYGQHGHINAGAVTQAQDAPLRFVNGANFVAESGFVLPLSPAGAETPYAGLYRGNTTFTALPATIDTGGPAPGHASLGAFIEAKVLSLQGPADAEFAMWQENDFGTATKLVSISSGATNGTAMFALSENDKTPGSDPYGHIHGRLFTLSKPGFYTVGFQLVDTSANGTGGGPIHAPSDIFNMYFQAGITIAAITRVNGEASITFATAPGSVYQVEAANELIGALTVWKPIGDPYEGRSDLHTVTDSVSDAQRRFYRLKVAVIEE